MMLNWLSQVAALTRFNLQTLPQRKGSALAAMVGIAGVVAVLVGVLSIGAGFKATMTAAGSDDSAVVLRAGSDSELTSGLSRDEVRIIADAPGVAVRDGIQLASAELFVIVNLPKKSTGTDANVPMRGVEREAFMVRPEVQITEGRMFEWGRNEVIVGRASRMEFAGLDIGNRLQFGQNEWEVVGVFESEGSLNESEIWADAAVVQPAYRRGSSYQIVIAKLASAGMFQEFRDALTADPRVNLKIVRETDYYAGQAATLSRLIFVLGTLISSLMAIGAIFGALNTMYTAVASRTREIATLKALGFRGLPVVVSVLIESLLLALVGGAIGAVLAYFAFDGFRTATMNWQSFSQIAFAFRVTPALLIQGLFYAVVIGMIGGLFPAIRAARMPAALALRES
jgi:putative ABC transport system permease protein